MKYTKNERVLYLTIRIPFFVFNKIKNYYYGWIFSCEKLIIGKNVSFRGTKNISIGNYVSLGNQSWIDAIEPGVINIGSHVSFSQNVHVAAKNKVIIGDGCLFGSDVLITDHDHSFSASSLSQYPKDRPLSIKGPTILGKNVWLGDNVKILSGVELGNNVVVAANSVVTKSFEGNVLIGGIPAKKIKKILE